MCFCRLEIIHSYHYFFAIVFFGWNWWGRPSLRKGENVWKFSLPSVSSNTLSDSHITTEQSRTLESTSYHPVNPPISLMLLDLSWVSEYRAGAKTILKLQRASAQGQGQRSREKEGWFVSRNQKSETQWPAMGKHSTEWRLLSGLLPLKGIYICLPVCKTHT